MKQFFSNGKAYPWYHGEGFHFRGWLVTERGCLCGASAESFLKEQVQQHGIAETLSTLNGVYSFLYRHQDTDYLVVDRLRSLPLFYAVVDDGLWVGDDAMAMAQALPKATLNANAVASYTATKLYVLGPDTLLNEICQVEAGSYCEWKESTGKITKRAYFSMEPAEQVDDFDTLRELFADAYRQVGDHLVEELAGRTAVVPLSGGADSRMVLSLLKERGYKKVLCFTYGRPGNAESEISRKVAAEYGYSWEFVPYSKEMWKEIGRSSQTNAYYRQAFNLVSTPHMQDYAAVKVLHESGKLPQDSVFIPGHSGDMIAGSHISSAYLNDTLSRKNFLQDICHHFFVDRISPELSRQLDERFPFSADEDLELKAAQSAWFNVQERQAKFIVNSVRVYEFFGYEWLIPLWDNALFEFWAHVPIHWKYDRKLYFAAVDRIPVKCTADKTPFLCFCEAIRSVPGLRNVVRRGTRVLRYWRSSLYIEQMFPFGRYLIGCLRENQLFDVNYLIYQQQLDALKQSIANPSD